MADIEKEDWVNKSSDEQTKLEQGDDSVIIFDNIPEYAKSLFTKLNENIDKTNTHTGTIATNTAKTGISTAQASAITANTNKTTISSGQTKQLQALALADIPLGSSTLSIRLVTSKSSTTLQFRVTTGKTTKVGSLTLT
jgi:hypothetical protein